MTQARQVTGAFVHKTEQKKKKKEKEKKCISVTLFSKKIMMKKPSEKIEKFLIFFAENKLQYAVVTKKTKMK